MDKLIGHGAWACIDEQARNDNALSPRSGMPRPPGCVGRSHNGGKASGAPGQQDQSTIRKICTRPLRLSATYRYP